MPVERFLRSGWIKITRRKGNVALKRIMDVIQENRLQQKKQAEKYRNF